MAGKISRNRRRSQKLLYFRKAKSYVSTFLIIYGQKYIGTPLRAYESLTTGNKEHNLIKMKKK